MCMKLFGRSEKKETEDYEKKYLARYRKQQKPKNTSKNKKDGKIESDEKNQVEVKIQKKNRTHSLRNSSLSNRNTMLQ